MNEKESTPPPPPPPPPTQTLPPPPINHLSRDARFALPPPPTGRLIEYLPASFVIVPAAVPLTTTCTPGSGNPSEPVTLPVTIRPCAVADSAIKKEPHNSSKVFIILF